jgi:hypothetical protein
MFQKFSWTEYWTVVIAGVAVYYAIVFLLLYRNGLLTKPSFKRPVSPKMQRPLPAVAPPATQQGKSVTKLQNEEIENQLNKLTDELLQFLQDIAGRSYIKEEIIMGLQVILREYKEISETNYRSDIDEFIKVETENHCSVNLSDDEIKCVWMG